MRQNKVVLDLAALVRAPASVFVPNQKIRGDLAIKIFGEDTEVLASLAQRTVQIPESAALDRSARSVPLVVAAGTPLRVALTSRVRIRRVGTPVIGRLVEPIYAFNREVIPAGSEVSGRLKILQPVAGRKRTRAMMAGDFTPLREPQIKFDGLTLKNGTRLTTHRSLAGYPISRATADSARESNAEEKSRRNDRLGPRKTRGQQEDPGRKRHRRRS